mmetsp:Transcript_98350/g.194939  ORF Transcript_98350/g.194939 Transcript_98350/m.194939 type:complete len:274 (-) Transcript_98350:808-1629(-)
MPPCSHHVHFRSLWSECCIDQPWEAVIQQQGFLVVIIPSTSKHAGRNLATVCSVVQERHVGAACGNEALKIRPASRVNLVISPLCQHHGHIFRQPLTTWVCVQQQGRPAPKAHLPQRHNINPTLGGTGHQVGLEPVNFSHDLAQIERHWKVWLLGVWNADAPVDLKPGSLYELALDGVQLKCKSRPNDEHASRGSVRKRFRHGRSADSGSVKVPLEVSNFDAFLPRRNGLESCVYGVKEPFAVHHLAAISPRQHEFVYIRVLLHSSHELKLGN